MLRSKLAEAISKCCQLETNRALFGKAGAVSPLVSYLTSADLEVHRTTAAALHQLSKVSILAYNGSVRLVRDMSSVMCHGESFSIFMAES